jgi:hypothetical protein
MYLTGCRRPRVHTVHHLCDLKKTFQQEFYTLSLLHCKQRADEKINSCTKWWHPGQGFGQHGAHTKGWQPYKSPLFMPRPLFDLNPNPDDVCTVVYGHKVGLKKTEEQARTGRSKITKPRSRVPRRNAHCLSLFVACQRCRCGGQSAGRQLSENSSGSLHISCRIIHDQEQGLRASSACVLPC